MRQSLRELGGVTGYCPMQYRMVRPIVKAVGLDGCRCRDCLRDRAGLVNRRRQPAAQHMPHGCGAHVDGSAREVVPFGIAKVLGARGVKTPAGRSTWQPAQVSRLLAV